MMQEGPFLFGRYSRYRMGLISRLCRRGLALEQGRAHSAGSSGIMAEPIALL